MTDEAPAQKHKSMAATLLLAGLLGFTTVAGVGHIYLGRARRGIIIMLVAVGVVASGVVLAVAALPEVPDPTSTLDDFVALLMVAIAAVVVYVGFVAWSVYDAGRLCRTYNAAVDDGGAPW